MSQATRDTTTKYILFKLRDYHPLRSNFPDLFVYRIYPDRAVPLPRLTAGLGYSPFARHYSENRYYFLFLWLLRCFSSPGSPPLTEMTRIYPARLPHSDTPGSKLAYSSPRIFAVRHVLLRHLVLRHPPCALYSLHHYPYVCLIYYAITLYI